MKKCPKCNGDIAFRKLVFLTGNKTLKCGQCNSPLKISMIRLLPFTAIVTIIGILFGLTYASTGFSVKWLIIIAIYLASVLLMTPFFLKLEICQNNN